MNLASRWKCDSYRLCIKGESILRQNQVWLQCESMSLIDVASKANRFCIQCETGSNVKMWMLYMMLQKWIDSASNMNLAPIWKCESYKLSIQSEYIMLSMWLWFQAESVSLIHSAAKMNMVPGCNYKFKCVFYDEGSVREGLFLTDWIWWRNFNISWRDGKSSFLNKILFSEICSNT